MVSPCCLYGMAVAKQRLREHRGVKYNHDNTIIIVRGVMYAARVVSIAQYVVEEKCCHPSYH
jgi:hypothetical protein